jgi:hypothetical protein
MKPISSAFAAIIIVLFAFTASAQEISEKSPLGFSIESVSISKEELSSVFELKTGNRIDFNLGENRIFSGIVMHHTSKKGNLNSVMIRSADDENSVMQITRQELEANQFKYVGRILNKTKEEGYKITCDDDGTYSLTRFDASKLIEDCNNTH